ncbi:MAG: VRR-NUC domain-containing protein, partial [bacterium]
SLYSRSRRPPSRERRVRILTKLERYEDAKTLCQQMLATPVADEEAQFAEMYLPKLHKALGLSVKKQVVFRPISTKLTLKPGESRVEVAAREFYAQFGECFYVENSLLNGVLGLFIWDIVFLPMPNVFFNPFQSSPADFYQPEFRLARQEELTARWTMLDDEIAFGARVWESFETKQGIVNPLVNWGCLSEKLLRLALMRIPVAHFRILFDRILADLANNSSGLPDLILFDRKGGYEFIEIKGPGDAVQKNQKRWMQYFTDHRIPYRVVQVRWSTITE